ncbi:MAG: DUF1553 domain-containing protein [Planctomycetota bacterium]|nr:MAG: DUF1553 domain-containing protein [Planctomycetota bacterium]
MIPRLALPPSTLIALVCSGAALGALGDTGDTVDVEFFETKIRPTLAEHCTKCHGERKQRSGLRLDSIAAILRGGERGPALVPGDADASLLIRAIRYTDEELQMPERGKLSDAAIEAFERWVESGAPAPGARAAAPLPKAEFDLEARMAHWSFGPVRDPELPAVSDAAWPLDTADAFILARLDAAGLAPAQAAERHTWLRRVTFDLTGLPPTPDDVAAFAADRSRAAHDKVVERLLASPRFGERWARHWLDLVRYAETKGHEFDAPIPNAWQYRDWVIRAFNADVPYDVFVTEQLAGDLVDPPRLNPEEGFDESVLGTGFWLLGEEVHSPVDIRADETDRLANEVDVLSKAFLGLTVACARCHDHKFDAISTRDYYAMVGFPLSSAYRQVRFETAEHNRRIAAVLATLRDEAGPALGAAVGVELEVAAGTVAEYLTAAAETRRSELVPDVALAIPTDTDILFEDFERATYGAWTTDGCAFGIGPVLAARMPKGQGDVGARGLRCVNSYAVHGFGHRDAHLGALTSPAFEIERDYIHFLIGGGGHADATCVQLVVDREVVRSAPGRNENRMRPHAFDVREWRGRRARIRIVDDHAGGWGNVGVDHIVFSDDADPRVLALERKPEAQALRRFRIAAVAQAAGLEARTLEAWADALERAAEDEGDLLHAWAVVSAGNSENARDERLHALVGEWREARERADESLAGAVVRVDYGAREEPFWRQDGPTFGPRPVAIGDVAFGTAPGRPLVRAFAMGAARKDPVWDVLELAEDFERGTGRLDWIQSGRTLYSPTFTLTSGKLHYLVQGAGAAYAVVDSYRLNTGPLHGALVLKWGAEGDGFRWIEHDLADYVGHVVHVEFTPAEPAREAAAPEQEFALARIIEDPEAPEHFAPSKGLLVVLSDIHAIDSAAALAEAYEEIFTTGAAKLTGGTLGANGYGQGYVLSVDWMLRHPALFPTDGPAVRAVAAPFLATQAAVVAAIRPKSATAPAMIDGSGVDEHVLIRGSARSPGPVAQRRFLEALAGAEQAPIVRGSGRLELARRITDPSNPFLARVWANRVWQHLFGRGIVASVDDFGAMGSAPTHPELLDHLATRLAAGGWSTKALIHDLALSRTYRMSSRSSSAGDSADPENLLLHRMPVRRLEGEAIRDAILAASGALDTTAFGPPVPVHLTAFMEGRGRPATSGPLDGAGRRSIYLAIRRNFLPPFFQVFDFPPPATTRGRRSVSNVPAQALTLMNDPFVVEQAERWADRVLAGAEQPDEHRIEALYRTAFARSPDEAELRSALAFLAAQAALHAAEEGGPDGVRQAWADLCHVLYNVKEFVFLD